MGCFPDGACPAEYGFMIRLRRVISRFNSSCPAAPANSRGSEAMCSFRNVAFRSEWVMDSYNDKVQLTIVFRAFGTPKKYKFGT